MISTGGYVRGVSASPRSFGAGRSQAHYLRLGCPQTPVWGRLTTSGACSRCPAASWHNGNSPRKPTSDLRPAVAADAAKSPAGVPQPLRPMNARSCVSSRHRRARECPRRTSHWLAPCRPDPGGACRPRASTSSGSRVAISARGGCQVPSVNQDVNETVADVYRAGDGSVGDGAGRVQRPVPRMSPLPPWPTRSYAAKASFPSTSPSRRSHQPPRSCGPSPSSAAHRLPDTR